MDDEFYAPKTKGKIQLVGSRYRGRNMYIVQTQSSTRPGKVKKSPTLRN